jgi:hypothetical protein
MRITKLEANYRRGDPIDSCATCGFYQGHGRCSQVMGDITPYGFSDVYHRIPNPFGQSLTNQQVAQIKAMMPHNQPMAG